MNESLPSAEKDAGPVCLIHGTLCGPTCEGRTAEKDVTTCPLCHSSAYVCNEPHTDGPGARIHCRAASLHNFRLDDPRVTSPGQRVTHYPTGPDGDWWTEGGAHPGTRADCARCLPPGSPTSEGNADA